MFDMVLNTTLTKVKRGSKSVIATEEIYIKAIPVVLS